MATFSYSYLGRHDIVDVKTWKIECCIIMWHHLWPLFNDNNWKTTPPRTARTIKLIGPIGYANPNDQPHKWHTHFRWAENIFGVYLIHFQWYDFIWNCEYCSKEPQCLYLYNFRYHIIRIRHDWKWKQATKQIAHVDTEQDSARLKQG